MRRKLSIFAVLALGLLAAGAFTACGSEEETKAGEPQEAEEGEPIEVGELRYNVQITRFLNPDSTEDRAYLRGLPDPPQGEDYLAVFIRIENEGEESERIPSDFPIENNRGDTFTAIETDNPFALELGEEIPPGGQLPAIDTAAASGPIKGSMILYLIDEEATENRPLEMEITSSAGDRANVLLDL